MPRTILDVSRWQGRIDWDKVKASGLVSGVMIRAMGNSKEGKPSKPYIDPFFARNYAECTRLGIPVGVYGYFKATTKAQADKELALFKKALGGRTFQLPVAVDIEDKLQEALSKATLTDIVAHCLSVVESWGVYAMLYTGLNFGQTNLYMGGAALKPYDVWLAAYRTKKPAPGLALWDVAVHQQRQDPRHRQGRRPERGLQGLRCHHPAGRAGAGQGVRPMASYLISDAPYAPWLSEVLATLEEHKIDRITVAAPLADGEVFTGYYNMNTQDKALLASNIQADVRSGCGVSQRTSASSRRGKMT